MRFNIFGQAPEPIQASGPSSASASASTSTATPSAPKVSRSETIIRDEQEYQAKQYPTSEELPGCMQLFTNHLEWKRKDRSLTWTSDEFMSCYALVPQLRSFYRQGEFRDCTWKWHDFKYCLSLKSASGEERRQLWIKRRADWWAARRLQGSSEDVWDLRT